MAFTFWQRIAETPWWFFLFFVALLRLGMSARTPKSIPFKRMLYFPAMYFVLTTLAVLVAVKITAANSLFWIAGILAGCCIGWLQGFARRIKGIKNESRLYFPGSWVFFVLVTTLFLVKMYLGIELTNINTRFLSDPNNAIYIAFLFGLVNGTGIGRVLYAHRVMHHGPFVTA